MGMFHYYDLSYSEIFVFDDYIINQIRENEEINTNHIIMFREIIHKHFSDKDLIYISNREKAYNINPLTQKEVEKIPNLTAVIIVAFNEELRLEAQKDLKDFKKPNTVCKNLTEAIFWADELIKTKKV